MGDSHNHGFFGPNTGLLINSPSKYNFFTYIRCIKKKPDGQWEKPSLGAGTVIKFSLEELISLLDVLNKNKHKWTTFHTYKNTKTMISISWEDEKSTNLWLTIGTYSKMLTCEQSVVFKLLLNHILKEKIKYATSSDSEKVSEIYENAPSKSSEKYLADSMNSGDNHEQPLNSGANIEKNLIKTALIKTKKMKKKEMTYINGSIKGETQKALLINFNSNGRDVWIPKSTIHNDFSQNTESNQQFLIDDWVLKRNEIIS